MQLVFGHGDLSRAFPGGLFGKLREFVINSFINWKSICVTCIPKLFEHLASHASDSI